MAIQPEFSRILEINESMLDTKLSVSANKDELSNLAERFALHSVKFVEAEYIVSKKESIKGAFTLSCVLRAEIVKFVIENTGEKAMLEEEFDIVIIDEKNLKKYEDFLQEEDIEIVDLDDPKIDIGEMVAQYLSLFVYM